MSQQNLSPEQLVRLMIRAYNNLPADTTAETLTRAAQIEQVLAAYGYNIVYNEETFEYELESVDDIVDKRGKTDRLIDDTGLWRS